MARTRSERPDFSTPPTDRIERLDDAVIVPPGAEAVGRRRQRAGVLTAEGRPVPLARTWRLGTTVAADPHPLTPETELDKLAGRWLFLGSFFGHFGHFLVESTSRFWALDRLRGEFDGLLWLPRDLRTFDGHIPRVAPLLKNLGVDLIPRIIMRPTRVEHLIVPQQGFGLGDMIVGTPEYRAFMRGHAGRDVAPDGPDRLYISRMKLPKRRGTILCEGRIERLLAKEGFVAYHPQKHDLRHQMATYKAARMIVSTDCSPLHLVAMVGDADQKVAVITRRQRQFAEDFARHIRAFSGADTIVVNHILREWGPEGQSKSDRTTISEIDQAALAEDLAAAGFLPDGTKWGNPTEKELAADLARLEKRENRKLVELATSLMNDG